MTTGWKGLGVEAWMRGVGEMDGGIVMGGGGWGNRHGWMWMKE